MFFDRNPNEAQESDPIRAGRQERVRMKNIEWTAYEAVHKKYLNIDIKSKLKNHYRAHRLVKIFLFTEYVLRY